MTLPQNVKDAVGLVDRSLSEWRICQSPWQTIRAHLLSQDASMTTLRSAAQKTVLANDDLRIRAELAESRLAAANELLRECRRMAARLLPTPHDLYEQIDAFLQGAAHDRA